MTEMDLNVVATLSELVLGGVFSVLWWLLRQKDEKQAQDIEKISELIKDLYLKHQEDERELYTLRIKIAENHPPKQEIEKMISDVNKRLDQLIEQISQVMVMVKQ